MTLFQQPCDGSSECGHLLTFDSIAPADDTDTVIRADDHTCPHCSYLNYCQLTPNHSGPHMCSQGHAW